MNFTKLVIPEGSSLTVYIRKDSLFQNNVDVNVASANPRLLTIYNLGDQAIILENKSQVYANIISPDAPLHVKNNCDFYGSFTGLSTIIDNSAGFHIDGTTAFDSCGNALNDQLGVAGLASLGGITSANSFRQWYTDDLGTNLSMVHTIDMVRNGTGVYQAIISEFHPIDDRLFGNEGDDHNYYFTYEMQANFIYKSCQNQFFRFQGTDDAWMFINGELVLDIGGVIPGTDQVIELDRLELTDGESYQMKFFYAQRQGSTAEFNLATNVELLPPFITFTPTVGYD